MLLGAGLAGLGGALAGCSTAAVPYGANEAGVVAQNGPGPGTQAGMPRSGAMSSSGGMSSAGAVITGPAPSPLPKKQIKIADGKVVLI